MVELYCGDGGQIIPEKPELIWQGIKAMVLEGYMERKYYIDNLRWLAILLLFPFHTMQIWNGGEYAGFYIWSHTNMIMHTISTAIYPWYMTLLFVIAGMSSSYALQKRTAAQFISERVKKLLIPSVFGILVLVPPMTFIAEKFFNGYTGSYIDQYCLFFTKETDLTGYNGGFTPAHLWFLIYLFVISLVALLVIRLQEKYFQKFRITNIPYIILILLFIPEWLMLYVFNISGKSIGQFLILFLVGYYIISKEAVLKTIKKYRFISLFLWGISGCIYTYLYCFANLRNEWGTGLFILFGWLGILALLGIGQTILNFHNKINEYFTRASFPIYIIHQTVLVVIGYYVLKITTSIFVQFSLIVLLSFMKL